MLNFGIKPLSTDLIPALQEKIDNKTKPLGSLGKLETLALKLGQIQNTLSPQLKNPTMLVFAADHGIAESNVSPCPQEITYQMVYNFLKGGAGINVFTQQHGINIKVVDAGVKHDFPPHPNLIDAKIAKSTKNFLNEPAMTESQCIECLSKGAEIAKKEYLKGCNIIGFGEMGIGNTSPATIFLSLFCNLDIIECTGVGAGLTTERTRKKAEILKQSIINNPTDGSPLSILRTFGGFEIAMMIGSMLKSAELGMTIMIDGFIATAAILLASKINKNILDYCIFSHKSEEKGHILMLEHLNADPILNLNLRLGEGTGVAIAYPIIVSAVTFINKMETFDSANVSRNPKD